MNTSKGWYNTVLQINNELESRTKSDHSHPLDLLLKEQTNTLIQLFNDCEFVGFSKTDPEAETIVSNVLANVQNSLSDKMGFVPENPFFNLYLGLCYLEKVLQLIKQEYENNLNTTLEHLESIIYNSNDYQNLVEVSRNIGRRVINEQQHPEFGKLKEHIAEQLEYIERTNKIEKTLPPQQTTTEKETIRYTAKHYVLAYLIECNAKGESFPIGQKKELEKIGSQRIGAGKGHRFYREFNNITNSYDINKPIHLIEIGGENWRTIVKDLSNEPETIEAYLQSKQL